MDYKTYAEKADPAEIMKWLMPYIGHEHLMDIKQAPSLEKYLAIAPDIYVMASMIQSMLMRAAEQKEFASYGKEEKSVLKPWKELTPEEKISEAPLRDAYLEGLRKGRDQALAEMADRITHAARHQLDQFRLENPVYDPAEVITDTEVADPDYF